MGDFSHVSKSTPDITTASGQLHVPDITTLFTSAHTDRLGAAGVPSTQARPKETSHPIGSDHQPPPTRPTDATKGQKPEPTVDQARARLDEVAARHFANDPTALANFQKDRTTLEQRMARFPNGSLELERTYTELADLMDKPSQVVPQATREKLACEVMHTAAHPETVNQGWSSDCAAAVLETRMYTRTPSQAARVVTENALNGQYDTYDGKRVALSSDTLNVAQTGMIPQQFRNHGFEERNLSDQIFQCTLRNMYLKGINEETGSTLHYELAAPDATHPYAERVMDYSTKPPKDVSDSNGGLPANSEVLEHAYQQMSGTHDSGFIVDASSGVNSAEFRQKLQEAYREGRFPLLAVVNSNSEPWKTQMGVPDNEGTLHAVTINNYDPRTGMVDVRNPYFGDKKQSISANDLFESMHTVPNSADVQNFSDQIKKSDLTPEKLGEGLYELLDVIAPSKRAQFLADLEKSSGKDLYDLLTEEQRSELDVGRSLSDRIRRTFEHL